VKTVKEAYLAVVDGPDPRVWEPWGVNFEALSKLAEQADLNLPSVPYQEMEEFRIKILRESKADLLKRENWTCVVGAIVEAGVLSQGTRDTFALICTKLKFKSDAWFRRYGFYILVVLPSAPSREQLEFWHELRVMASYHLGAERIKMVTSVLAADQFTFSVPLINRTIIFEHELESIGIGRRAS